VRLQAAEERVRGLERAVKSRSATPKAKTRSTSLAKKTKRVSKIIMGDDVNFISLGEYVAVEA
jgi:hypothetical protein